ncbi:MAG: tetratricopeptide repeat protein [Planctomycetota bacterium]|nr:tetratricopeptide repeat protein [Planctomycetota bacterium]
MTILLLGLSVGWAAGCAQNDDPYFSVPGVSHYVQGAQEYERGNTQSALADLTEAVKESPDLTMAHVMLGDIYKNRSDYRNASDHYALAAQLDPYDFKNHYNLGLAYQFLNRLQEAAAAYLRALKLNPQDLDSTMNLGLVYLGLNHPDDALNMMWRAVGMAPKSASAHCNLGVALEAKHDYADAEREFRRAVELDADSAVPLTDLAENLIHQSRGAEAALVMEAALKISDTPDARQRYADALVLAGRDDDALQQYVIVVRRLPGSWLALDEGGLIVIRKYIAGASLDERLRRQAVAIWKRSLTLQPDQPRVAELIKRWDQDGKISP